MVKGYALMRVLSIFMVFVELVDEIHKEADVGWFYGAMRRDR